LGKDYELGHTQKFSGRLGNQFFQANFLMQLSIGLGRNCFHRTSMIDGYFRLNKSKKLVLGRRFKITGEVERVDLAGLDATSWDDFFKHLESIPKTTFIDVAPGILGSIFYQSTHVDPKKLFTNRFSSEEGSFLKIEDEVCIGVHFRGGDFQEWDPHAVLPISYYRDSIQYIKSMHSGCKLKYYVATDDKTLPSYQMLLKDLTKENVIFGSSFISDFINLGRADYIVSTPSTFAIWSAILGNKPKVIQSSLWLQRKKENGDLFWSNMEEATNSYYDVFKFI